MGKSHRMDLSLCGSKSLHETHRRSRTLIENAVQSCLLVSTLSPENAAKARILRARARLAAGYQFGAQEGRFCQTTLSNHANSLVVEDLQAALVAEPDNPEAMALLHQRSVTVAKVRKSSQIVGHLS